MEVTVLIAGSAAGPALVLEEPLSMWGGLDPATGLIIDGHHPQHGVCVTDTILFMPYGRGSSSASSVLAEAVRVGTAPAAFVLAEADEIIALGSVVAEEIYGTVTPVLLCAPDTSSNVATGDHVTIADEKIAPHSPGRISHRPSGAIRVQTSGSEISSDGDAARSSTNGIPR
jgi:predicted aconitase with swiveling domain